MREIMPIAGVLLAVFAAGCVAYIAWAVVQEAESEADDDR